MKIKVVSNKDEINTLNPNEEIIHLAFRPSNVDVFELVNRCPNMKALQMPGSYKATMSKSVRMFLEMQGITLMKGSVWGHRKDINEYSEVSQSVYDRIKEYQEQGMSDEDTVKKMSLETKMSLDLLRFIIKERK